MTKCHIALPIHRLFSRVESRALATLTRSVGRRTRPDRRAFAAGPRADGAAASAFEEMAAEPGRRYFLLGGKGGVGKTSLAAALAVKFANRGHPTLVVSTDPAHSLSDSLAVDVSGGQPVAVEGTDAPLFGLEVNPEDAQNELRAFVASDSGQKSVGDFMSGIGLGAVTAQLEDLHLGELLDTPPPGLDEAVAISKASAPAPIIGMFSAVCVSSGSSAGVLAASG